MAGMQNKVGGLFLGMLHPNVSVTAGTTTSALSAAGTWLAQSFITDYAININEVSVYCSAVTGTLAATDCVCAIYGDLAGKPNTSLGSTNTLASAATAGTWSRFTGLNIALAAQTQYWAVFSNVNATPASNYPTYTYVSSLQLPGAYGVTVGTKIWGPRICTTINSGTAWSLGSSSSQIRLKFSDGTYDGCPVSNLAADATNLAYGSNYVGAKLTLPGTSAMSWNIKGVAFPITNTGAATGAVKYMLFVGNAATVASATATTAAVVGNVAPTTDYVYGSFASPVAVPGGSVIRVAVGDTAADSAGTAYQIRYLAWDTDANSVPLMPNGAIETAFNGTSWTDIAGQVPYFTIFFDSVGGEVTATGSNFYIIAD